MARKLWFNLYQAISFPSMAILHNTNIVKLDFLKMHSAALVWKMKDHENNAQITN